MSGTLPDDGNAPVFTTTDYQSAERDLDRAARSMTSKGGFGVASAHISDAIKTQNSTMRRAFGGKLSAEQQDALHHVLGDKQLSCVVGLAGAGKTEAESLTASANTAQKIAPNGVEVDNFSLFASEPHPHLSGVEVTTGIRYVPEEYPDRYVNAWCYFFVERDGSQHRIRLGTKDWGTPVVAADVPSRARRAAGITRDDISAGRTACQWPTP